MALLTMIHESRRLKAQIAIFISILLFISSSDRPAIDFQLRFELTHDFGGESSSSGSLSVVVVGLLHSGVVTHGLVEGSWFVRARTQRRSFEERHGVFDVELDQAFKIVAHDRNFRCSCRGCRLVLMDGNDPAVFVLHVNAGLELFDEHVVDCIWPISSTRHHDKTRDVISDSCCADLSSVQLLFHVVQQPGVK